MSRISFLNVPTSGHVYPTYAVVRELARRGHEVIYYLTEAYRQPVEATGARFRAYDENIPDSYFDDRGLDGSSPPRAGAELLRTTQLVLPRLLEALQADKPDLIIHDSMCPWGWMAAKILDIRSVSSSSLMSLSPSILLRSGAMPTLLLHTIQHLPHLFRFQQTRRKITREYRVRPPGFPDVLLSTGTITVSYTSAMFQPGASGLDGSIKFVGPSIEPRADSSGFPFDHLDGRPLVYISLGTVINRNLDFYQQCLQAFDQADLQVVMSIGKRTEISALGSIPANFIVRQFVPQLDILQRTAVFITHSGMNSVHEGLYYDVPLLLVPQQMEQRFVALRVEQLGAGLMLRDSTPSAAILRETAQRILKTPSFKQNAARLGESFRSAGGYKRAADEVEAL